MDEIPNKIKNNMGASVELNELVSKSILESSEMKGAGSFYQFSVIAQ